MDIKSAETREAELSLLTALLRRGVKKLPGARPYSMEEMYAYISEALHEDL